MTGYRNLTLAINLRAADSLLDSLTPKLTAYSPDTATDPAPSQIEKRRNFRGPN